MVLFFKLATLSFSGFPLAKRSGIIRYNTSLDDEEEELDLGIPDSEFDEEEEEEFEKVIAVIRAVRNRRSEMNVPPSRKAHVYVANEKKDIFETAVVFMQKLASASDVTVGDSFSIDGSVSIVTADAKIYIPMGDLVDFEAERKRLLKDREAAEKKLAQINGKLNNPGFLAKAPQNVIDGQKADAEKLTEKIKMIDESLAALG